MNDRSLLLLAAKAAGISIRLFNSNGHAVIDQQGGGLESCLVTIWNPLVDDGQALRLAVGLALDIHTGDESYVFAGKDISERGLGYCECHNGDPLSATRRAIVRAAAEIGRGMA